ncbi:conjugal transfer protein TraF [Geopsychrobacter electrodiphilus]|uniref:conjugal transfer protein TraF n=1 Tax=Geopsychrobacter electrodiphilus TaxID=225196 RepID=UPI0003798BE5|nr:conjugal transfer protein TraF [Geopsychrobacter electrodiphilus]
MIRLKSLFLIGVLICLRTTNATAYQNPPERGYWWYETPPKQEEQTEEEQSPTIPDYTSQQMMVMDSDKLKEYAEQVTKEAIRVPSEENVKRHYLVQDVIRRKARAFTNVSEMVWQKYPELTTAKDNPLTAPGRNALTRAQVEERRQELALARKDFALLYLRSDTCEFCQAQDQIIPHVASRLGWKVKPINIDTDSELAKRLGVETVPTLILISKGSQEFFPVTTGVSSVTEIESHLFRAIRLLRGETTPDNFNLYDFQKGGGYDVQNRQ